MIARSIARTCATTSLTRGDRIADELAGAVVGDLAAAVDVDDLDPRSRYQSSPSGSSDGSLRRPRV